MAFKSEANGVAVEATDDYTIKLTGVEGRGLTIDEARNLFARIGTAINVAEEAKRDGVAPTGDSIPMVDFLTERPP